MRSSIFAFVVLSGLAACWQKSVQPDPIKGARVSAIVSEDEAGRYRVDYSFAEAAGIWFFPRSSGDYRLETWQAMDEGVRLTRAGAFDALVFDQPRRSASFMLEPFYGDLQKDYSPFVQFTDGSAAMFTGQFELMPAEDLNSLVSIDGDLSRWEGEQPIHSVRMVSDRPMIVDARPVSGEAVFTGKGGGTYIYIGNALIEEGRSHVGVIDPGLPGWLLARFDEDLFRVFESAAERWGFELKDRATTYFAFGGYGHEGSSTHGGVLGNVLIMRASGEALREENAAVVARLVWFFAHEAMHLFQGAAGARSAKMAHSWIHEGGANAMAYELSAPFDENPEIFLQRDYAGHYSSCAASLQAGSLEDAVARGDFNAYYSCGNLIAVATDGALADHDLYDFWNVMIDEALASEDKGYDDVLYFRTALRLGAGKEVVESMRAIVYQDLADPAAALADMLMLAGLDPQFDEEGTLASLDLPRNRVD